MRFLGKYFSVIVLRRIDIEIRILSRNAVPSFLCQTLELLARFILIVISELVHTKCYISFVCILFSLGLLLLIREIQIPFQPLATVMSCP